MSIDSISDIRKKFEAIDKELLIILGKRQELSKQIVILKKKNSITILQTNIWEHQFQKRLKESEALNINAEFLKALFTIIHEESIRIQTE